MFLANFRGLGVFSLLCSWVVGCQLLSLSGVGQGADRRFPFCHPPGRSELRGSFNLVAQYRAILRYYRCDTPYRAIPFEGG